MMFDVEDKVRRREKTVRGSAGVQVGEERRGEEKRGKERRGES